MKLKRVMGTILLMGGIAATAMAQAPAPGAAPAGPPKPGLTLTSMGIEDGGIIPAKYTQSSQMPVSPDLEWTNVPAGTMSFILLLHDPDAAPRKGSEDVTHWLIFNIPGTATSLPENVPPTAQMSDGTIQAKNLRGNVGFMGPGAGAAGPYHHYTFELYALDTKLMLGPDATRADILKAADGHILGKGVLEGRFHR
jgi:Raf kinase inhibitor-like YbhB/YbcL family protein